MGIEPDSVSNNALHWLILVCFIKQCVVCLLQMGVGGGCGASRIFFFFFFFFFLEIRARWDNQIVLYIHTYVYHYSIEWIVCQE